MNDGINMKYDDEYSACKETYTTLLIYPGKNHPDKITELLEIEPSNISIKGEGKRGRKQNGWFLTTQDEIESKDCRRHIDWLLDIIEPKSKLLLQLQSEGVRIEFTCFWVSVSGNGGPTLSPPQMKRLAILNIEIWWDVYFE